MMTLQVTGVIDLVCIHLSHSFGHMLDSGCHFGLLPLIDLPMISLMLLTQFCCEIYSQCLAQIYASPLQRFPFVAIWSLGNLQTFFHSFYCWCVQPCCLALVTALLMPYDHLETLISMLLPLILRFPIVLPTSYSEVLFWYLLILRMPP